MSTPSTMRDWVVRVAPDGVTHTIEFNGTIVHTFVAHTLEEAMAAIDRFDVAAYDPPAQRDEKKDGTA